MSGYAPFARMGTSCKTREIRDKRVVWPLMKEKLICGDAFRLRLMGRGDQEAVAELWRQSYPELYGSIHGWMLFPDEYDARVAALESWESDAAHKPHAVVVADEIQTGRLAMASLATKFDQNLQVEASYFAIHPDYRRGQGGFDIWSEFPEFSAWMAASGAEYITVFCETWHEITQYVWFKRFGWKVAGIFPGHLTRWSRDGREYRACTVHFYRLVNDGERYCTKPEEWRLLPDMRKLWECLEEINRGSEDGFE
jgi:hypothetical protein